MKINVKKKKGSGGEIKFIKIGNSFFCEGAVEDIAEAIK